MNTANENPEFKIHRVGPLRAGHLIFTMIHSLEDEYSSSEEEDDNWRIVVLLLIKALL